MNLSTALTHIKGVGPKTAESLSLAGLETVGDLVTFWPRTHEDFSHVTTIDALAPGKVTIKAKCEKISTRRVRRGMTVTTAVLSDGHGKLNAVWFNQPYRATQLTKPDEEFFFSGEFEFNYNRYQLTNPSVEKVSDMPVQTDRILPVYRSVRGLKSQLVRKILSELRPLMTMLPETLPNDLVRSQRLMSYGDAVMAMHFPEKPDDVARARARLGFEELFQLLLASQRNRDDNARLSGPRITFDPAPVKSFVATLPFVLTNAQRRAAWEIMQDFEQPHPMNRLLQGDVGAGKTVVAGLAAHMATTRGFQVALLAPTEILAAQHAATLSKLFAATDTQIALYTGSVKGKKREALLEHLKSGQIDIVVGTHALLEPGVQFANLGFVIIDEQHRFGVAQRQKLLTKAAPTNMAVSKPSWQTREPGAARPKSQETAAQIVNDAKNAVLSTMPHLLSMTATPIPRSLQLTVFGELDVSVLDELPPGRQAIETKIWAPTSREALYKKIDTELAAGRQAYVITRLIDDNPKLEQKSAEAEFKKLKNSIFSHRRIGLMHGKLKPDEKAAVMNDFAAGKLDILVSTTVVEVGVDVPNATVMLIENADQFGLSQLHQLRGRVGRGRHQSYCYLMMSDSKKPSERLREIEKSQDGFYLAEVDLKLRGPGEIYGRMQHGALNLEIASLADTKLIKQARDAARAFTKNYTLDDYPDLESAVERYQKLTTLN